MVRKTTIEFEEVELTVAYDYQPYEPMTRDYPGCEASVEVGQVFVGDVDITTLLSDDQFDEIAERIFLKEYCG